MIYPFKDTGDLNSTDFSNGPTVNPRRYLVIHLAKLSKFEQLIVGLNLSLLNKMDDLNQTSIAALLYDRADKRNKLNELWGIVCDKEFEFKEEGREKNAKASSSS